MSEDFAPETASLTADVVLLGTIDRQTHVLWIRRRAGTGRRFANTQFRDDMRNAATGGLPGEPTGCGCRSTPVETGR